MKTTECPACHSSKSIIIDSRLTASSDKGCVQRRRECQSCGQRWYTWELDKAAVEKLKKAIKLIKEIDI